MITKRHFRLYHSVACLLISQFASNAISPVVANIRGARTTNETTAVQCRYAKRAITDANGTYRTIDQCIIDYDGHVQDLPEGLIDQHDFVSGHSTFKIHGARIRLDEDGINTIDFLDHASVEKTKHTSTKSRNLQVITTIGTHVALVMRVTSLDAQVVYDRTELGILLFSDIGTTLTTVYNSCSFGKFNIVPYQGAGVVNGVAELFYDGSVAGQNPQYVENMLLDTIRNTYGWEGVNYDHLLIVLPPGTQLGWDAYSYIGYYRSVFNNDWSGYVSANVHEVGHTLGLQHSSRNGNEYMDQTGFMGYSYASIGMPAKCFNGHKNYLLGWYSDRLIEIVPSMLPWSGNLVTFVDYKEAQIDEPVLININHLYLQYNRAKSFNYQTKQNRDEITVTEAPNQSSISSAVGSLSMSNTTYTVENYLGNQNLIVEVCAKESVSDNGRADLYRVIIYMEAQPLSCDATIPPGSTLPPTLPPRLATTRAPTVVAPTPPTVSTSKPTLGKRKPPPTSQSPGLFTPPPTAAPSSSPTATPTKAPITSPIATPIIVPTASPTATSINRPTTTMAATARPHLRSTRAPRRTLPPAFFVGFSPGSTSVPTSNVITKCIDSSGVFRFQGRNRNCYWLAKRSSASQRNSLCAVGTTVYQMCKATCKVCS